ncbi:MAG: hypothetical protein K2Y22_04055 [Candidatus Obscuribacterales bacterium]|nr:hypothetical protein [Candidatus Obscuribacterales bacterium]
MTATMEQPLGQGAAQFDDVDTHSTSSNEIKSSVHNKLQGKSAAGPTIPLQTEEEVIRLSLLKLAQSEPDELKVDVELEKFRKKYNVGKRTLKSTYRVIYDSLKKQTERNAKESAQQLNKENRDPEEERKRKEEEEEFQKAICKRTDEIKTCPNIAHELQETLKRHFGYIADMNLAGTISISHGSRLLSRSMGFVFSGPSASGKSDAIVKASNLLPPEIVINSTSYSNRALFYLGSLRHKYVIGGELKILKKGEDDDWQQAFRQLISEGSITRTVVEKGAKGELGAQVHTTEGPATFTLTTTLEQNQFNDEFANRLSWCMTKDDAQLTAKVLDLQAKMASIAFDASLDYAKRVEVEAWRTFHRGLRSYPVQIPYAKHIVPKKQEVTIRRLFPLLLNYTQANALLHQHCREVIEDNVQSYIVADINDYKVAYDLVSANAPRVLDLLSARGRKNLTLLKEEFGHQEFTRAKAQQLLKVPDSSAKRYLSELTTSGCLCISDNKEGKSYLYKVVDDAVPFLEDLGLVHPDEVIGLMRWADG